MLRYLILGCAVLAAGCEQHGAREAASAIQDEQRENNLSVMNAAKSKFQDTSNNELKSLVSDATVSATLASLQIESPATLERKIIYQADLRLVIADFSNIEADLSRVVKEQGGYLANVSIDRTSGERRTGRWQVRIPTDTFDLFLEAVSKLGVPESRNQTAQDVTEEFVDLEARIANQKRLEERIVGLLEETKGTIKDVIEVERELGRVRGEIEKMEGRLRFLTNRAELTTVTVYIREQRDYVPPQAPTFVSQIGETWGTSLISLRDFGGNILLAIVAAAPWLIVSSAILAVLYRLIRRRSVVKAAS
jgi:hypothetical protein